MKKINLIVTIIVFSVTLSAQNVTDSLHLMSKTAISKTDSITNERINNIEQNVTKFYKDSRASQWLLFIGGASLAVSPLLQSKNSGDINIALIAGTICETIGGILFLTSYSHLNFEKKKKIKFKSDTW